MLSLNSTTNNFWFTADTHFGHGNILAYDNRPFSDIKVHDTVLIGNWNEVVQKKDPIFFIGDFALTNIHYAESILARLNGVKYFIRGNHDKHDMVKLYQKYGEYLGEQIKIAINAQKMVLNHFAMLVWDESHRGSWQLHGHSHGGLKYPYKLKQLDVGINNWNYYPINFDSIKARMDAIPDSTKHHER
jgi:calcineurin-like phosphoesterase family protein